MSHITMVDVEIKDLEAVKALCKERGWEFMEGKKSCTFWGGAQHPCDHAIKVPGAYDKAEIGLVSVPGSSKFSLAFDPMCFKAEDIGNKGGRFMQGYAVCKAEREAKRNGMQVRRVAGKAGAVKLVLTGGRM